MNQSIPTKEINVIKEVKNNKRVLLKDGGFTSITQARKNINGTDEEIYNSLLKNYLDKIRQQELNELNELAKIREEEEALKISNVEKKIKKDVKKFSKGKITEVNINLYEIFNNTEMQFEYLVKILLKNVSKYLFGANVLIQIGDVEYCLNDNTINRLEEWVVKNHLNIGADHTESDGLIIGSMEVANNIKLTMMNKAHKNKKVSGAFFPHIHKTKFNFERYGIFHDIQAEENTCLLQALLNGGLDDEVIEELKCYVKNRRIPKSDFETICNIAKIRINLKNIDDLKNTNRNVFGKKYANVFNIGVIEEHYFINEKTLYTSYCIENYDEVKNERECNFIYKKRDNIYRRDTTKCINSFNLIKLLVKNKDKLLTKISCEDNSILSTQYYEKFINDDIINLEYSEECVKANFKTEEEKAEEKPVFKKKTINVFCDFETDPNDVHIPYLFCYHFAYKQDMVKSNFWGEDCGRQGLNELYEIFNGDNIEVILIFHNAKYDYRFIIQYGFNIQEISNGNIFISSSFNFAGMDFMIKDSYKMITMGLRNFPKVFNLGEMRKEVIPYEYYNQKRVCKKYGSIVEALEYLKTDDDKAQFLKNIDDWDLRKGDKFHHRKYAVKYCEMDCEILMKGYDVFREWIWKYFKIDINKVLTISSLAYKIFEKRECYDETYALGGKVQNFINRCVVGGRTMCANNEKKYDILEKFDDYDLSFEEFLNDLDAVSLYPSAYVRMNGFLKGKPKVITNTDYNNLKNKDGYFVKIHILNVRIKRDFPLMSYKNNEGVRIFSNDMIGKDFYADKITLEDLIEYQHVDFTIIKGYYYDDGFNNKCVEVMRYIFEKRIELKRQDNSAEIVFKLIMNSAYGKNIQKPHEEKVCIYDNEEEFNVYLSRNYNWIKEIVRFGNKIKVKSFDKIQFQYNNCHIGCEILSMSKRIMNEVMCLAEDNNIKIYYQDTDSTHLKNKDIVILQEKYELKYNKKLIGKDMGQFHSDFSIEKNGKKYDKNVFARRSIFLGKKAYIDELIVKDKNGNEIIDYHIRLKGIPNRCVDYTYKKLGYANPFDLYIDLYNGVKITFDLLEGNGHKKFKFNKDYTISTLKNVGDAMGFSRTVSF
jgi:hypothetical protein